MWGQTRTPPAVSDPQRRATKLGDGYLSMNRPHLRSDFTDLRVGRHEETILSALGTNVHNLEAK
jgi:hypothetical protein